MEEPTIQVSLLFFFLGAVEDSGKGKKSCMRLRFRSVVVRHEGGVGGVDRHPMRVGESGLLFAMCFFLIKSSAAIFHHHRYGGWRYCLLFCMIDETKNSQNKPHAWYWIGWLEWPRVVGDGESGQVLNNIPAIKNDMMIVIRGSNTKQSALVLTLQNKSKNLEPRQTTTIFHDSWRLRRPGRLHMLDSEPRRAEQSSPCTTPRMTTQGLKTPIQKSGVFFCGILISR